MPSFAIATGAVSTAITVSIAASYGAVTRTATLTVNPVEILRVELSPSTVISGKTGAYSRVGFDGPVPPEGAVVTLTSSDPALVAVPASVFAPGGGLYSGQFATTTASVTTVTSITISASYRGLTVASVLTLKPAQLNAVLLQKTTVIGGTWLIANRVVLDGPAPVNGAIVALTSTNAAASVPATVTVPAGASWIYFTMITTAVPSTQTSTVTAAYAGVAKAINVTINP